MKKKHLLVLVCALGLNTSLFAQAIKQVDADSAKPASPTWEKEYWDRVNFFYSASPVFDCNRTARGDSDNGKRYWPLLTAEIWKAKRDNDNVRLMSLITKEGASGMNAFNEGTFNKPFSAPGYILYYFGNKDILPQDQKDRAKSMWESVGRVQTTRADGNMDPIYKCTEFNSENFTWMGRIGGYMLAHELNDNEPLTVNGIDNVPAKEYFDNWIKNWVRGTFNGGRVEWSSHIYTGFCHQAAAVLHTFGPVKEDRDRAKAVCDWLMAETAINYLDGAYVSAETRDKGHGYEPLAGSVFPYYYLYFATPTSPNVDPKVILEKIDVTGNSGTDGSIGRWFIGFPPQIKYRPSQAILDLAHRNFKTPVEIQTAKPFWHLDEKNYEDWKAETSKGRRNEFETKYLEKNYTLASMASYRPATVGPFWEACVWRMGVKQATGPAVQIFGNTGDNKPVSSNTWAGRNPYEEIGQYRSAMVRMARNVDNMWVAIPADKTVSIFDDTIATVDMGKGVYVAFKSYNSIGAPAIADLPDAGGVTHKTYMWKYDKTGLAALVLEAGTEEEYKSYDAFKDAIVNKAKIQTLPNDVIAYKGANNHELKMQYMPTGTYTYMANDCKTVDLDPAGVPGKVWGDGNYIDYSKWNIYEVVYGDPIIHSEWGKGQLTVNAGGKGMQITIDQTTAEASYKVADEPFQVSNLKPVAKKGTKGLIVTSIAPNPSTAASSLTFSVEETQNVKVNVYDLTGRLAATIFDGKASAYTDYQATVQVSTLAAGSYIVRIEGENVSDSQKIVVIK